MSEVPSGPEYLQDESVLEASPSIRTKWRPGVRASNVLNQKTPSEFAASEDDEEGRFYSRELFTLRFRTKSNRRPQYVPASIAH